MNEPEMTSTTPWEWLLRTPTVVVYRPDGQLLLDQLPDMNSPDAVVCFTTMHQAKRLLRHARQRKRYRPVNLPMAEWLEAIGTEAEKGRTHLSVWSTADDVMMRRRAVPIEYVLSVFELAAKMMREGSDSWRWN
jgi:hypothetical protein